MGISIAPYPQAHGARQSKWRSCGLWVGLYTENGAMLLVGIWL